MTAKQKEVFHVTPLGHKMSTFYLCLLITQIITNFDTFWPTTNACIISQMT